MTTNANATNDSSNATNDSSNATNDSSNVTNTTSDEHSQMAALLDPEGKHIQVVSQDGVVSAELVLNKPVKSKVEILVENINSALNYKGKIEAAYKKIEEINSSITLLEEKLLTAEKEDEELKAKVDNAVRTLKSLDWNDDAIALALQKQYGLTMPAVVKESTTTDRKPNATSSIAQKMGQVDSKMAEDIVSFVRTHKEGVGMKQLLARFPEYVRTDTNRFATYVRSLYENGQLMKLGERKGTKYFAK